MSWFVLIYFIATSPVLSSIIGVVIVVAIVVAISKSQKKSARTVKCGTHFLGKFTGLAHRIIAVVGSARVDVLGASLDGHKPRSGDRS